MLGFQSRATARVILGGIEMVHMIRKGQAKDAGNSTLSLAEQVERRAAGPLPRTLAPLVPRSEFATQPSGAGQAEPFGLTS